MTFAFHVSREARERYEISDELFTLTGNVVVIDQAAGRRLALRINQVRQAAAGGSVEEGGGVAAGGTSATETVNAGQLTAMGLLDEILHRVTSLYERDANPRAMAAALGAVARRVGPVPLDATLTRFVDAFPTAEAYRAGTPPAAYLAGSTDGIPNREIALQELLQLWLDNANPAFGPFEELFDDAPLATTAYPDVVAGMIAFFATQPAFGPDSQTLVEMLRSPAVAVPDSIGGQLRFVRERWSSLLGDLLDRLIRSMDVLAEEEQAVWRRFHPAAGGGVEDPTRRAGTAWLSESGWYGSGQGEAEDERFSVDRDWMPQLVLMAKSTYVWLDQLSKHYGRTISRLDGIPDEEFDRLARWGFTGLWLIGLWERSEASQTIKVLRGNPEAVASAYSLDDYRIADDLGGEAAFEALKRQAWTRGIRIGSDMVPNHMGIDSRWVMEHPDWFISVPDSPYPAYSFTGPDLSTDGRVGIYLEDHYLDNTDAAVVFRRVDHATGDERFVYHGNDGTSMPWNDTAQLDYLNPEVREAVIRTILAVARRSPVIRFDAAMTLAKRHIERLWFPEPGQGGGIPSRAEHSMPKTEFERRMPIEFWREVVDRVAAEVPDTLLLAEAFWLMEGYFVRTLGMHRVYNSAFMNMLRDEQNANYRSVMKNTLEFDPEVLKRYVNFMNNPDERTAVDQFGKGDKYFGIATVMATLPGLPMFGHGQFEGFTEKYGMEYRRAYWDEQPDRWLVERHEREIVPLLHRRALFAQVDDFLLYDFVRDDGTVDEDVYAYSNRGAGDRSLIVFLNKYATSVGTLRHSVAFSVASDDGERSIRRRSLGEGLGLHADPDWFVVLRDARDGLEYLRSSADVLAGGLRLHLDAYSCRVFLGIHEVQDEAGRPWRRLAAELGERGVPSLEAALAGMLLRPVQEPFRRLLTPVPRPREAVTTDARAFLHAARELADDRTGWDDAAMEAAILGLAVAAGDGSGAEADTSGRATPPAEGGADGATPGSVPPTDQPAGRTMGEAAPSTDEASERPVPGSASASSSASDAEPSTAVTTIPVEPPPIGPVPLPASLATAWQLLRAVPNARDRIDEWRLGQLVADALRSSGMSEADAWRGVAALKALLTLPPWRLDRPLDGRVAAILASWVADDAVAQVLQLNTHRDVRWFNKESFETFARWSADVERLRSERPSTSAAIDGTQDALVSAAVESGYRFDVLRSMADRSAERRLV